MKFNYVILAKYKLHCNILDHILLQVYTCLSQVLWLFNCSVVSDSLRHHGLQHTRLPCPISQSFLKFMSIESAIQPSHPLLPPSPPSLNFSQHEGFSSESTLHIRWPKHWSFSFSISPSNEYSGLISFRIDWFDLLADQGTLNSLL